MPLARNPDSFQRTGTSEAAWMPLAEHTALSTLIESSGLNFLWGFLSTFIAALHCNYSSSIPRDIPKEEWPFFFWMRYSYLTPASTIFSQWPTDQAQQSWLKRPVKDSLKKKFKLLVRRLGFLQRSFCLHWNIFRVCKLQQVEKA